MTPELVFRGCGNLAAFGWLLLLVFPRRRWTAPLLCGLVLPALLCAIYAVLLLTHLGTGGGFGSLAQVAQLFSNPWVLLAGWVHYLAFDLFIGSWEVRDAARLGIPHWTTIPCLLLTFLVGPCGLLLYLGLRGALRRRFALLETTAT